MFDIDLTWLIFINNACNVCHKAYLFLQVLKFLISNICLTMSICFPFINHTYLFCCFSLRMYHILGFFSKSSVLLGLALTVPLMVACLSVAIPIWVGNGYRFWVPRSDFVTNGSNHPAVGRKEVTFDFCVHLISTLAFSQVA